MGRPPSEAGVLTLSSALHFVVRRARLMQSQPPGGVMVALRTSQLAVQELLKTRNPADVTLVSATLTGAFVGNCNLFWNTF